MNCRQTIKKLNKNQNATPISLSHALCLKNDHIPPKVRGKRRKGKSVQTISFTTQEKQCFCQCSQTLSVCACLNLLTSPLQTPAQRTLRLEDFQAFLPQGSQGYISS